jgi:hypothetical protein
MLHIGFGDKRAIDELAVFRSSSENAATLKPGDDGGDRGLGELSVGV